MAQFAIAPKQVNTLLYTGSDLYFTPATQHRRAPTIQDRGFPILTFWRNMDQSAVLPDVYGDIWILIKFIYNPVSDKSDAIWVKIVSGGGTGPVFSLTPDTGGVVYPDVSGNINVFGLPSNSAQVMETEKIGNDFYIENRTWETAYVVDQNSTPGERGTFSTIQSAYDAIVADGVATINQWGTILVRPGSYAGFTHAGNVRVQILGSVAEPNLQVSTPAVTIGASTITTGSGQPVLFTNVNVSSVFTEGSTETRAYNSRFLSLTGTGNVSMYGGELRDANTTGGILDLEEVDLVRSSVFAISSSTLVRMNRCYWNGGAFALNLTGTTNAIITNCERMDLEGNTTGNITVQDTTITNPIDFPSATSIRISGVSQADTQAGGNLTELITQVPTTIYPSTEGNIASRRIVTSTGNVTQWDQYVACRQSGAITLTLTPSSGDLNFFKGQKITIADESGTASTNIITIIPSSGTVNGVFFVVIAQNYGSITLIYDGTNWFTDPDSLFSDIGRINGDSGSITGTTVTLYANRDAKNAGSSVSFTNSGSTSTFNITDATNNTFLGKDSGTTTVSGANNSAQGFKSMPAISSGDSNCGLGSTCFENLTTGNQNVGLGVTSLQNITSGSGNVGIGHAAGANYTSSDSSNIVLQNSGVNGESNTMRLGSTGAGTKQVNRAFIAATFGTTVGGSGIPVVIDSSEQLGTVVSSKRFKENIEDLKEISSRILELRPVVFNYIKNKERGYGLIAEEVQEIMPELVVKNQLDEIVTVKYLDLPVMILNELQKLAKRVEELERRT